MRIEEQVLSREQMAHLVELGVDTSDASMMWVSYDAKDGTGRRYLTINNGMSREIARMMNGVIGSFIPTYTIGDLIVKVPKKVGDYKLKMDFDIIEVDEEMRQTFDSKCRKLADDLYNILCWVAENHKELIK